MKTEIISEIHIFKIVILLQSVLDRGEHVISKRLLGAILILLATSICLVSAYIYAQENKLVTQTIMSRAYYYVDNNTSDVDSSSDKGNQANFTAQQYGPDSVYDTLTEEGATEIIEDYVDSISDVDSSPDIGTHSSFNNMKAYDSTYDTLNETSGTAEISKVGSDTQGTGTSSPLQWSHTLVSGTNRLVVIAIGWENNGPCTVTGVTYGGQTCTEVIQSNTGGVGYLNGAAIYYIDENTLPSNGANQVSVTFSAPSTADFNGYCMEFTGVDLSGPDDWDATSEASPPDATIENTGLSAVATDLCVSVVEAGNTGSFTHGQSQNERIDFTDASSQFAVTDLIATGSISQLDSTFSGINNRLCRMAAHWSPAAVEYDLDLEVQFTNIIDFLATENLCIYIGTMGVEALNVSYWTGSSWSLLDSDLTASSWNNYTVSLIGVNFTIRFETETLTGDSSADEYQVDAVLLQVSGVGIKEDPVDQQSDIDSSPDVGTHSDFSAQQYGPDSIYDTLTEEDVGGGSTTFGKTDAGASSRGFTGYLEASRYQCGQDFTVTKILLYLSGCASGRYARTAIYSDSSGAPGTLLGESSEQEVASDGWHEFTGFNVPVSESTYYWLAFQISTSNLAYHYDTGLTNQHAYRAYTYGSFPSTFGTPNYAAEALSIYATSSSVNYKIDVEIQWEGLPNSLPNKELCIRTGTFSGSETIQVKVWNSTGSSWHWIMNLTANQWNNVSITDYLTSNQFTIQFLGGDETGDSTEDTWEIDVAIIHIWIAENCTIDLEVQWTNVDYSETNEELCIYGGTMESESLRVDVWTGASWQNIIASLSGGWNNVSISAYLVSSTFTIRFKGNVETDDATQDNWEIDATLLHLWT